jgi:hypothetical protein
MILRHDVALRGGSGLIREDRDATGPSGRARIRAFRPGSASFQAPSFVVNPARGAEGAVMLTVRDLQGKTSHASVDVEEGLTLFGVIATGGDLFRSATLSGCVAIDDVRQLRLSDPPGPAPAGPAVPEPGSLALIGIGAGTLAVAAGLRRRSRASMKGV